MKKCSSLISIASHTLQSNVFLAPMAGVTDLPFRKMCQAYGAGLTTSEMVIAKTEHWRSDKSRLRFESTHSEKVPHSIQIVGGDASLLANAARQAVAAGAEIIDINMGCPAKKVCKKAAGSALLKDELLVADILTAVVNSVAVPVTLKIRTGWDKQQRNAVRIARIAEDSGIQALAIHGRTRACRFVGEVEFDTIASVKQAVSVPVIANGDIDSVDKALAVAKYTKVDALMIGRGAQGQPWLIQQVIAAMEDRVGREPIFIEKRQCVVEHISSLHQFYGEFKGLRFARKHVSAYLERMAFKADVRQNFNRIETVEQQIAFLQQLAEPTKV